jgi:ATP/maltotriose-dependent transcriptional regulator MalT
MAIGEVTFLSTVAGILAEAIYAQGRYDEAESYTRISEESAGAEDVYSQLLWRSVRAKCVARHGDLAEALALAGECVPLIEATDALDLRWHAQMSRAEVLWLAGRMAEAEAAWQDAMLAAEDKENLVGAKRSRDALEGLVRPPARV